MDHLRTVWALSLWLFAQGSLAAPAATGVVKSLRGTLERQDGEAWKPVRSGQKVRAGERLRTGKDTVAVIELKGIGRYVVGPESQLELGRDPKDFKSELTRGALWMETELPKGNRAAISTPIAIAGVRGTSFAMVFGEGEKAVCACTCKGEVGAALVGGKDVAVGAGQYAAFAAGATEAPAAQASAPVLEQRGSVFDFCQTCHAQGGKGALLPRWKPWEK